MAFSLASLEQWLLLWAQAGNKESYLDVLIASDQFRGSKGQHRTEQGKTLRRHLFGSERAPRPEVVHAAIRAAGDAAALAFQLKPIIDAGLNAPFGALKDALNDVAAARHAAPATITAPPTSETGQSGPKPDSAVPEHVFGLGRMLCDGLRQMAVDASKNGLLYELRGTPEFLGHSGDQWESWITKELAVRTGLRDQLMYPAGCAERFHSLCVGTRGRNYQTCDFAKEAPGPNGVWIECKAIFESVLLRHHGGFKSGDITYFRDYNAEFPCADPQKTQVHISIEEAKIDARKLSCIEAQDGAYIGLLLLEFDRIGHQVSDLADYRRLREFLLGDGWFVAARERWTDRVAARAMKGFQEAVTFWARKIG